MPISFTLFIYLCYFNIIFLLGLMSREVLVLVGLFLVVSLASMCRAICFTLAGERFVARIRKNVS